MRKCKTLEKPKFKLFNENYFNFHESSNFESDCELKNTVSNVLDSIGQNFRGSEINQGSKIQGGGLIGNSKVTRRLPTDLLEYVYNDQLTKRASHKQQNLITEEPIIEKREEYTEDNSVNETRNLQQISSLVISNIVEDEDRS